MTNESVILFASSRPDGNTKHLVDEYAKLTGSEVIDLVNHKINHFNYKQQNDDFEALVRKILKYKTIIIASPVYWYSVSSLMKTFLDRLTELLIFDKELGRQLRDKSGVLLATGASVQPESCFEQQIKLSFDYLGMDYLGMLYCYCESDFRIIEHQKSINQFITANLPPNQL